MTLPKAHPLAGSKEVLISEKPFQVRAEARTVIEEAVHSGKSIYDVFRLEREMGVCHLQKLADLVAIRSPKRCTERPELRSHAEW